MRRNFPPPNQRRLNAKIAEIYGERYADWYDLAMEIYQAGGTYRTIRQRFVALGVTVSLKTIHIWLKERWAAERAEREASPAA